MKALINRLQRGDESVIKELYREYYHHCKWVVLNNDGSDEDAKEVFQQVILSIWEKVERGELVIKSTLKGYLYTACKYTWWNLKKNATTESLDTAQHITDESDADIRQSADKRYDLMYGCINQLGGECERLLEQTYFENLSDKEIAAMLNLKLNYVRIKRKRCMDRVKKCVEQKQMSYGTAR